MTRRRSASFVALLAMLVAIFVPVTAFADPPEQAESEEETEADEPAAEEPETDPVETPPDSEASLIDTDSTDEEEPADVASGPPATTSPHTWDGRGTDSLACEKLGEGPEGARSASGWIHWLFSTRGNGTSYQLALSGSGSGTYNDTNQSGAVHFYTPFFDLDDLGATVTWSGSAGPGGGVVISDYCPGVDTTPATTSVSTTKAWEINGSPADLDDVNELVSPTTVSVTFTYTIEDAQGATRTVSTVESGASVVLTEGEKVIDIDELVTGLPTNTCSFTSTGPTGLPYDPFALSYASSQEPLGSFTITNNVVCDEPEEQFELELIKVWLDESGQPTDAPTNLGEWSLDANSGVANLVSVPVGESFVATATVASGTEYTVVEGDLPGWNEVICPAESRSEVTIGLEASTSPSTNFGTSARDGIEMWTITGDTTHTVCNQRVPEPPEVEVIKVWTGDSEGFGTATFDVRFWGYGHGEDHSNGASTLGAVLEVIDSATGVPSGTSIPIPVELEPAFITIDETVTGAACDWERVSIEDTLAGPDASPEFMQEQMIAIAPPGDWDADLSWDWNGESFSVTFTNQADCPPPPPVVQSGSASVTVVKAYEGLDEFIEDGQITITDSPQFEVGLRLGTTPVGTTQTVADGVAASFSPLSVNTTYTVDVSEVEDLVTLSYDVVDEDGNEGTCSWDGVTYAPETATVTATSAGGSVTITATNSYTCVFGVVEEAPEPAIDLVKTAVDGVDVDEDGNLIVVFEPGDTEKTVTYQFVVTNTGDEALVAGTFTDDKIGPLTGAFIQAVVAEYGNAILPVGGSVTFTADHVVTVADFDDAGLLTNVAIVTAEGVESGEGVSADDDETVNVIEVLDETTEVDDPAEAEVIAFTGSDSGLLLTLGLLLSMMGLGALMLGRRRAQVETS